MQASNFVQSLLPRALIATFALFAALAGAQSKPSPPPPKVDEGGWCEAQADCARGLECRSNFCERNAAVTREQAKLPSGPWWRFTDSDGDTATCELNRDGKLRCEPSSNYRHGDSWRLEGGFLHLGSDSEDWVAKGRLKGSTVAGEGSNKRGENWTWKGQRTGAPPRRETLEGDVLVLGNVESISSKIIVLISNRGEKTFNIKATTKLCINGKRVNSPSQLRKGSAISIMTNNGEGDALRIDSPPVELRISFGMFLGGEGPSHVIQHCVSGRT